MLEPHTYIVSSNESVNDLPTLIKSFSYWIGLSESQVGEITDLALKLQSTFILTDDIESGAETRNGAPLSTSVFGVPFTLNSINMLYIDVCQKILQLFPGQELEYTGIFAEAMQNIIEEVGREVTLWETATYPTEEEYLEIIKKRNGGLLKLLVDLMQRLGKDKQNFGSLIDSLSAYLVIRKDLAVLISFLVCWPSILAIFMVTLMFCVCRKTTQLTIKRNESPFRLSMPLNRIRMITLFCVSFQVFYL